MDNPSDLAAVYKAFQLSCGPRGYVNGYVEWSSRGHANTQRNLSHLGLTPEGAWELAVEFVRQGGQIVQCAQTRQEYSDLEYYYKAVFPFDGLPRGVFVELILVQDDPDDPIVHIVNAHPQGV
jgi:hypothetical protein